MRPLLLASLALSLSVVHAADAPVKTTVQPVTRAALLGVDANNDGIRDDIQALVANSSEGKAAAQQQPAVEKVRLPIIETKSPPKALQPRSACLDYMMASPKSQQRVLRQTNGVPGTHPCDPVVSPLLDRPYEREFVQVGPVTIRQ